MEKDYFNGMKENFVEENLSMEKKKEKGNYIWVMEDNKLDLLLMEDLKELEFLVMVLILKKRWNLLM